MNKLTIKRLKELINDLPDEMQVTLGCEGQVIEITEKTCYVDYAYYYANPDGHQKCFCIDDH